jgi:excinuclease ABC subunit B
MYADTITKSMEIAINETKRRRAIQEAYNKEHGIVPQTVKKEIRDVIRATYAAEEQETYEAKKDYSKLTKKEREKLIADLEREMKEAAKALDFERAAELRDLILELKAEG